MKDIPGFEGLYAITEDGKVWSYYKNDFLKNIYNPKTQYYTVHLHKNGIRTNKDIHRLIAETYLPNPENKPLVDHIDRNKANNTLSNLRWVTYKENAINTNKKDKILSEAQTQALKNLQQKNSKKIECRDKNNHDILINTFLSTREAARQMFNDMTKQSLISACARGKKPSAYGYYWCYIDNDKVQEE